jgi:hypothetical protein
MLVELGTGHSAGQPVAGAKSTCSKKDYNKAIAAVITLIGKHLDDLVAHTIFCGSAYR